MKYNKKYFFFSFLLFKNSNWKVVYLFIFLLKIKYYYLSFILIFKIFSDFSILQYWNWKRTHYSILIVFSSWALKTEWWTLFRMTPSDATNSQQFFRVEKLKTILRQTKIGKHECREHKQHIWRHSGLPIFEWWRIVLYLFDLKQLLRVFCIWWLYFVKCSSQIFKNSSLWCFLFLKTIIKKNYFGDYNI